MGLKKLFNMCQCLCACSQVCVRTHMQVYQHLLKFYAEKKVRLNYLQLCYEHIGCQRELEFTVFLASILSLRWLFLHFHHDSDSMVWELNQQDVSPL